MALENTAEQTSVTGGYGAMMPLSCPICGQVMVNLHQLNRHLDDVHTDNASLSNADDGEDVDPAEYLKQWFNKTKKNLNQVAQRVVVAAPQISIQQEQHQQLQVKGSLAQKDSFANLRERVLKRSESLSSLSSPSVTPSAPSPQPDTFLSATTSLFSNITILSAPSNAHQRAKSKEKNSAALIDKSHWDTNSETCNAKYCGKALGILNGKLNCFICGYLFCEQHSRFYTKVNQEAQHDPVHGIWCRVCERCYTCREGYNEIDGAHRTWTDYLRQIRRGKVERTLLESNLLEKRLDKLRDVYKKEKYHAKDSALPVFLRSLSAKSLDQTVVPWQPDHEVKSCPMCQNPFSLLRRRSHCRLCGKVICGEPECCKNITLSLPNASPVSVKACRECKGIVARRQEMDALMNNPPTIVKLYEAYVKCKDLILSTLPKFNDILVDLSGRKSLDVNGKDYQQALRYRKSLLDLFADLDKLAKKIKTLPTNGSMDAQRLQDNIYVSTIHFLQERMFTLQLLPTPEDHKKSKTKSRKLTKEEKAMHDALVNEISVLEEQRQQVESFMVDATSRRKFEDAQMLKESLDELILEISMKRKELEIYYDGNI